MFSHTDLSSVPKRTTVIQHFLEELKEPVESRSRGCEAFTRLCNHGSKTVLLTAPGVLCARVGVRERDDGAGKITRSRTFVLVCPEFTGFELYSLAGVKTRTGPWPSFALFVLATLILPANPCGRFWDFQLLWRKPRFQKCKGTSHFMPVKHVHQDLSSQLPGSVSRCLLACLFLFGPPRLSFFPCRKDTSLRTGAKPVNSHGGLLGCCWMNEWLFLSRKVMSLGWPCLRCSLSGPLRVLPLLRRYRFWCLLFRKHCNTGVLWSYSSGQLMNSKSVVAYAWALK